MTTKWGITLIGGLKERLKNELGAGGEGVLIAIFVLLAVAIVIAGLGGS